MELAIGSRYHGAAREKPRGGHAMKLIAAAATVVLFAALTSGTAISQHVHPGGPVANGPYAPRLGDLMILQQIRHAKLWFAVAANNWPLAKHELAALKDGFEDVTKFYPTIHEIAATPVVDAIREGELVDLAKGIEAQDRIKFVVAYDRLTAACNACHQTTHHGFIVIQQPISPPFNNQSFAPMAGQGQPMGGHHPH